MSSKNSNFRKSIEKANDFVNKKIETLIKESAKCLNFQNESQTKLPSLENRNVILLDPEFQSDSEIIVESIEQQPNDMQIEPSILNKPIIEDNNNNDLISGSLRVGQVNNSVIKHKDIPTGGNSHKCSVCGKYFRKKNALRAHYIIHTGEKPFHCTYCTQRFKYKSHLDLHTILHTGENPVMPSF